ncbi:tetratricopeptide repeat protein [Solihabitans fulvus]|uniref:Tetratricopeptide repeat protein n=1 Tax=Solihabitans fulvus TaxID=1892852 RepID=A0A5B2XPA9_9PSEU|nr:BTAD domain-containing putative transcriptional regulator [Solihabitans fulvus]KAA2264692.1 tetratricopeptide repeat protein [Solihabitans fulvus]
MTSIDLRLLGPLEVAVDDRAIVISRGSLRALLAVLALRANSTVTVAELVEWLWGESPPADARAAVQTYVMRLRRLLGPVGVLIRTAAGGYLLCLEASQVDVARFDQFVDEADRANASGDAATASARFGAALALWRGQPLSDVPSELAHREVVPRLAERRLYVLERRIDADLALHRHAEVVGELRALTAEYPFRERFWALLIRALSRSGRAAEALTAYREVRELLAEQLGVEPGAELRELHERLLAEDAIFVAPERNTVPAERTPPRSAAVPAQLPSDIPDFVGRDDAVRSIESSGAPIVVLSGPPGVGKTALAVHAAHRLRARFPDGQLYVDLRGYSRRSGLSTVDILARFLRALGVPPEQLSLEQDELAALYRSTLAGRRVLVVLDNAAAAESIRPLVPGEAGCLVLVTSRDTLRGLTASHGAGRVDVPVLDERAAGDLVAGIVGDQLSQAEPAAVADLIELCDRLPLALRIAATNLIDRPQLSVANYVDELRTGGRLAALVIEGDDQAAVRAAFDLSYSALKPGQARMFRLAGVVPGTDFSIETAAALSSTEAGEAGRLLRQLTAANLVQQRVAGRYQFHDLLRVYAQERAEAQETAERPVCEHRLFVHYLVNVEKAVRTLYRDLLPMNVAPEGHTFADESAALTWLDEERSNVVAAIDRAVEQGLTSIAAQLTLMLFGYFYASRRDTDWLATGTRVLALARREKDSYIEASVHRSLAGLSFCQSDYGAAIRHGNQALTSCREVGWTLMSATCLADLGIYHEYLGEFDAAFDAFTISLQIKRQAKVIGGEATVLLNLGVLSWMTTKLRAAIDYLEEALTLYRAMGSTGAEAMCLANLGSLYAELAMFDESRGATTEALARLTGIGDRDTESQALETLAKIHLERGEYAQGMELARLALERAVEVSGQLKETSALIVLGVILLKSGRPKEAEESLANALALARQISETREEVEAIVGLTDVCRASGDFVEARKLAETAVRVVESGAADLRKSVAYLALARIDLDIEKFDDAVVHAELALATARETGQRLVEARALHVLGLVRQATGDTHTARDCWGQALAIFEAVGTSEAAEVNALLTS